MIFHGKCSFMGKRFCLHLIDKSVGTRAGRLLHNIRWPPLRILHDQTSLRIKRWNTNAGKEVVRLEDKFRQRRRTYESVSQHLWDCLLGSRWEVVLWFAGSYNKKWNFHQVPRTSRSRLRLANIILRTQSERVKDEHRDRAPRFLE